LQTGFITDERFVFKKHQRYLSFNALVRLAVLICFVSQHPVAQVDRQTAATTNATTAPSAAPSAVSAAISAVSVILHAASPNGGRISAHHAEAAASASYSAILAILGEIPTASAPAASPPLPPPPATTAVAIPAVGESSTSTMEQEPVDDPRWGNGIAPDYISDIEYSD
jgi:hypothetical protein